MKKRRLLSALGIVLLALTAYAYLHARTVTVSSQKSSPVATSSSPIVTTSSTTPIQDLPVTYEMRTHDTSLGTSELPYLKNYSDKKVTESVLSLSFAFVPQS